MVGSAGQPAEEKQAGKESPLSQCSAAEEKSALRPAAGEGTNSRPNTGRPASNVAENVGNPVTPLSSKQRHRDAQQDQ